MHINQENGHVYVGQSTQAPERRFRKGAKGLNSYKTCPAMYAALQKYGWDKFETTIMEWADSQEELNALEEKYINLHQSADGKHGYNSNWISEGRGKQAEGTKEKIRQVQLRRYEKMRNDGKTIPAPIPRIEHKIMDGVECKQCTNCIIYLPLINFGEKKDTWDKLLHDCRECRKLAMREYRKLHPPKKLTAEQLKQSYEDRKQALSEGQKRHIAQKKNGAI